MIVKNIKTNNKNLIIDLIIKELCENNISYVYIKDSSELHFNDYIFRFYENFFIYSRIEAPIWKAKEVQEKQKNDKDKKKKIIPEIILQKSYTPNQQNYPNIYL